jgi:hypothetical protein
LAAVAGGVALVVVARVAGHHVWWADVVAWLAVGVAVVVACRPTGLSALLVLAAPALSAAAAVLAVRLPVAVFAVPWPVLGLLLQGVPLAAAAGFLALRRGWRGSGAG